jgi:uncharacterized protein (DUF58 family)
MGSQEKYLKPEVIQQVKRLDLRAKFIVEGFLVGLQKSPFHGFSAEFSEHQKYEPGDDIARIDWSVYARTDRYYIKKFQAETNLTGYLVMDLSRSMDYPPADERKPDALTKFEYGICLAAALAYLMVNQSDAVGLVAADDRIRTSLPPKSRKTQLGAILSALAGATPTGKSNLAAALDELAGMIKHRSLVLVFSDLLPTEDGDGTVEDEIAATVQALYHVKHRGNDIIVFHILDRNEVEFSFKGSTKFLGVETDFALPAVDAEGLRTAYLEEIAALRDAYRKKCQSAGIDFVALHTGMPFDKALLEYLMERRNRF